MSNVHILLQFPATAPTPENYTHVGGVYGLELRPQFLPYFDNVQENVSREFHREIALLKHAMSFESGTPALESDYVPAQDVQVSEHFRHKFLSHPSPTLRAPGHEL